MNISNFMRKHRGVTLIELMTVIVVIAILASVAVPSYRRYLLRSQRADATTALLRLAATQEKHLIQYGVYVTATANIPNAHSAGGLGLLAQSDQGFYDIAVAPRPTGYLATATAINGRGQWDDTTCRTFSIDEAGQRRALDSGGADSTAQCFR